jgi:hypothetical protein
VRDRADAHLREEALVAEELVLEEDLLRDLLRAADDERAARAAEGVELRGRHRRPPALAPDPVHHRRVGTGELAHRVL